MSKSTLYTHFRNKDALVLALVEEAAHPFIERLHGLGEEPPLRALEGLLNGWQAFGDRVPPPMLLDERVPRPVRAKLDSLHERMSEAVHRVVLRAEEAGVLALEAALVRAVLPAAASAAIRARAAGELTSEVSALVHAFVL